MSDIGALCFGLAAFRQRDCDGLLAYVSRVACYALLTGVVDLAIMVTGDGHRHFVSDRCDRQFAGHNGDIIVRSNVHITGHDLHIAVWSNCARILTNVRTLRGIRHIVGMVICQAVSAHCHTRQLNLAARVCSGVRFTCKGYCSLLNNQFNFCRYICFCDSISGCFSGQCNCHGSGICTNIGSFCRHSTDGGCNAFRKRRLHAADIILYSIFVIRVGFSVIGFGFCCSLHHCFNFYCPYRIEVVVSNICVLIVIALIVPCVHGTYEDIRTHGELDCASRCRAFFSIPSNQDIAIPGEGISGHGHRRVPCAFCFVQIAVIIIGGMIRDR